MVSNIRENKQQMPGSCAGQFVKMLSVEVSELEFTLIDPGISREQYKGNHIVNGFSCV